ncbi:vitamin B12 dependent-methionine synthase activation domain-containing protein [Fusibacter sp. 3D3]|uniref:vitamin B12 dependent-methionine synthase activation domain-containing protein n=1 Tax=Fusibacter sp. 3D3 TaxID=1048380 RepID=UPI000852E38C|nr:vitamin B12 dependent-methionine synthase activation domain-containing protein [Fusibacter sp. 3D3]GAU78611.1 methionine synthase activation domain [Fusibacter sp. 3D3]
MNRNNLEGFITVESIESYVNKDDIYRYLNARSSESTQSEYWTKMVDEILKECLQYAKPTYTSETFEIENDAGKGALKIAMHPNLSFKSYDLTGLLDKSDQIHVVGVTLGLFLDRKIHYYMRSDATKGVILDACASVVIEACCDYIQDRLTERDLNQNVNLYHTNRYSPGYGDLGLDTIKPLSGLIQMTKKTGIHVSEHFLMQPQKSVIFIMGVSKIPLKEATLICEHKCLQCQLKSCQYREGLTNEFKK